MIVPTEIQNKYNEVSQFSDELHITVGTIIGKYCQINNYLYASRVKNIYSVVEKIETGRFTDWSNIDDIVGFTVIVPSMTVEQNVVDYLSNTFDLVVIKSRSSVQSDPERFSFNSTRFYGKLKRGNGAKEYLLNMCFEVQIKTLFDYAWSEISHNTYKGNAIMWENERLMSLIKASVEQLDLIVASANDVSKLIKPQTWAKTEDKKAINNYILIKIAEGAIRDVQLPGSMVRVCGNIYQLVNLSAKQKKGGRLSNPAIETVLSNFDEILKSEYMNKFPLSVTITQFFYGVFISNNIVKLPLKSDFSLPITNELLSLFPTLTTKEIKSFVFTPPIQ